MVEEWLELVENVVSLVEISNTEKVRYIIYLLKAYARVWLNLIEESIKVSEDSSLRGNTKALT